MVGLAFDSECNFLAQESSFFSFKVKDYYITYLWPLEETLKNIAHSPWTFSLPFIHFVLINVCVCVYYI